MRGHAFRDFTLFKALLLALLIALGYLTSVWQTRSAEAGAETPFTLSAVFGCDAEPSRDV